MNKALFILLGLFISHSAFAAGTPHWTYSGPEGAAHWAKITPEFGACGGRNQSPINLSGFIEADLPAIEIRYQGDSKEILNNGHTVQVNVNDGSSIQIDGIQFKLLQFHFHAPSENHINGKSYPMEAHFVHADKDGNLAVIAVMVEQGAKNNALAKAWASMPKHEGDKHALPGGLDPATLLPADRDYYRFNGSLTTPPCSEGVRWLVIKQAVSASKKQIKAFAKVLHEPNNRPLQALNARPVLQ